MGYLTNDDAGIYRLSEETALVSTVDLITPPVDDPFVFGVIAAANSLSDIYAMGAKPLTCLNIAGFPLKKLGSEVLYKIIEGALTKISESGAVLVGGHTVEDEEPKFGLAVNGLVDPQKIWRNNGAKPGDAIILTKPLGSGVLFNGNLKGYVKPIEMNPCIQMLSTLNKAAAEVLQNFTVHAVTDVTGFGLAGHAFEMAAGSGVTIEIQVDRIPLMEGALRMYETGVGTGMNRANQELVKNHCRFDINLPDWHKEIVFDPQTNGGLLWSGPSDETDDLLKALKSAGVFRAARIGSVKALVKDIHIVFE